MASLHPENKELTDSCQPITILKNDTAPG